MKRAGGIGGLAAALTLAPGCASAQAADAAIILHYSMWDESTEIRLEPTGRVRYTFEKPSADGGTTRTHDALTMDIARTRAAAALIRPVHRWAGGTVPCDASASTGPALTDSSPPPEPPLPTIRWEPRGESVAVSLVCLEGPAMREIDGVRRALDLFKDWHRAAAGAAPASPTP